MKYKLKTLVFVTLCSVTAFIPVRADKVDFLVNDDGSKAEQNHPRVAVAGDGKFVIVWVDKRSGNNDIYLQRYDSDGNPVGGNLKVNDDLINAYQAEPAIAVDLSGLYSVVWKDYRNGLYPLGTDSYFQRYDTSVSPSGINRNLTTGLPDSLIESPDIALSLWGNGVVIWADYRNGNWDIYGQLISSNGSLIGDNFRINDDVSTGQQHAPRVSFSPEGWFVVTWYDNRLGNDDIFVQCFDSLGEKNYNNIKVNSESGSYRQAFPDIATDGAGHFTVMWVDWRNGVYPANPDIYYRKYDTSMIALAAESKINTDASLRAQREPAIAADRRGNLALVWSDSTSSSWDITGQIIDYNGKLQGTNFRVNNSADSAQLQPDIALDGRYRYVTWVDKRNGNYDIFASIVRYNDPGILPEPSALKFEMEIGGSLPATQKVAVNHSGFNSLNFSIATTTNWLTISPTSGITPDTLAVVVNTDTLSFGTYFGAITLIDTDVNDSSVVVSVRLDVTAPIMKLSCDTLSYRAYAGMEEIYQHSLSIENDGSGQFNWEVSETADWLTLSATSGVSPATIQVMVTATGLESGNFFESLIFNAAGTMGSPDTVWVVLEVIDNMPFIALVPDSFFIQTGYPETVDTFLVVHNEGVGLLNWSASVTDSWLIADKLSGLAEDTIRLSIDTSSLAPGLHSTYLIISDSSSFNISETLPFVLSYAHNDTVLFNSVMVDSGAASILPIELTLVNNMVGLSLPIKFNENSITVDSVVFTDDLPGFFDYSVQIENEEGYFLIETEQNDPDSLLAAGVYLLFEIYFTADGNSSGSFIDTLLSETFSAFVLNERGQKLTPYVIPGTIQFNAATGVNDDPLDLLPGQISLKQNFPNPFNLMTNINFELPEKSFVELEVFNILGQKVYTLISQNLMPGRYTTQWDGQFENGRTAPSGIYFYRLQTETTSLVRKMVLLK